MHNETGTLNLQLNLIPAFSDSNDETFVREETRNVAGSFARIAGRIRALRHAYLQQRETIREQSAKIDSHSREIKILKSNLTKALTSIDRLTGKKNVGTSRKAG